MTRPAFHFWPLLVLAILALLLTSCSSPDEAPNGAIEDQAGEALTASQIANGNSHTCVILSDETVKCWGSNSQGQLGLGDTDNRGEAPGQMGNDLTRVDLGKGRTAASLAAGSQHTCAILDNGQLKCWGDNMQGTLGLGDQTDRGGKPNQMGDNLPAVELGSQRTALSVTAGSRHTCALLDDHSLKCWGQGARGQNGSGRSAAIGVSPGQMGDALAAVNLGTGTTVDVVSASQQSTCALLSDETVKCWGYNWSGQLGQGRSFESIRIVGDKPGQMGDALPRVNLGKDRKVEDLVMGGAHACVRLVPDGKKDLKLDEAARPDPKRRDLDIKCWGDNERGQLGLGDTANRGEEASQMGDNLPEVDLGKRFEQKLVSIDLTAGFFHTCTDVDQAGDKKNEQDVKCWGGNDRGQLGLGDTQDWGDQPGQMGNKLPQLDLGTKPALFSYGIAAGAFFSCSLVAPRKGDTEGVKCWGANDSGQLGLGDTRDRGVSSDQMGNALALVDLGT